MDELHGKKIFGGVLLGEVVQCIKDRKITETVPANLDGVQFLCTGLNGVREGRQLVDFELYLESLDGEIHQTIPSGDFHQHFMVLR